MSIRIRFLITSAAKHFTEIIALWTLKPAGKALKSTELAGISITSQ